MKKNMTNGFFLATLALAFALGCRETAWSAPGDQVQQDVEEDDSHVWQNLEVMMKDSWKEIARFAGKTVSMALLMGILFFGSGAILGTATCIMLHRRSLLDAPFASNRYLKWVWFPLFCLSFALGFSYAGAFLGAGRAVKHSILEERIVDKSVASIYCALALDASDYQLHGQETLDEINAVLAQSEGLADVVAADIGRLSKQIIREDAGKGNLTPQQIWALESVSDSRLGKMIIRDIMQDPDPRLVILVLYEFGQEGVASREFQQAHPEAIPVVAALTEFFHVIREELCTLVDSLVYPNVCLGFLAGVGTPLLLLVAFRLGIRRYLPYSTDEAKNDPARQ